MNQLIEILLNNLLPILGTVLTAVISYIGMSIKKMIEQDAKQKQINKIVDSTVNYVEQITKDTNMTSLEKFSEAKEKALEWLHEKGIQISDTELDISIECAVKRLT